METFIRNYNVNLIKCKHFNEDGFSLDEQVFIDFFNRNEEIVREEMKYEIDEITNNMGDFLDSDKVTVTNWYLNDMLGIDGFYSEFSVQYNADNKEIRF